MPAPELLLIKHSLPEIDPSRPAAEWHLSAEGRQRCLPLAERLMGYAPQALYCSREPKAQQTAAIVGERLSLPAQPADDLHEHTRRNAPFTSTQDFHAMMQNFFAHPEQVVYGEESAQQAQARFERAVQAILTRHPAQRVAIVAHGTVITLFIAYHAYYAAYDPAQAFELWQRLELPSVAVLQRPNFEVLEIFP